MRPLGASLSAVLILALASMLQAQTPAAAGEAAAAQLTDEDLALLESLPPEIRRRTLALWAAAGMVAADDLESGAMPTIVSSQTVVVTPPIQSDIATVQPVAFIPTPGVTRARLPIREGYPQPSILVGLPPGQVESPAIETPLAQNVAGEELDYSDPAVRVALRAENPDLFADLLEAGALDPPAPELAVAIQTELSRMGCYRAGIDGIWGGGSRAAVTRYFDEVGTAPPTVEPEARLFRSIIAVEDVTCAAPQVISSRPASTPRPAATASAQPARPPSPPATQPSAAPSQPTIRGVGGTGLFR